MIIAYCRCSDGIEGDWYFETLPRISEEVLLRISPVRRYRVIAVEHWPTEGATSTPELERGVSLRLDPLPLVSDGAQRSSRG